MTRALCCNCSRAVYTFCFALISTSRNSKTRHARIVWHAVFNRHCLERVCELRTARTAYLVGLASQCEHSAEVNVMTPKKEVKDSSEERHTLSRASFPLISTA